MRRFRVPIVVLALTVLSAAAVAITQTHGWTLYYGDAESHLDIARRVVDSRTPGYDQIGGVWLPLPHALMLPFVIDDRLWITGLAGALPSAACFVIAGTFLFTSVSRVFHSNLAALASLAIFALNPTLLYLQATPMTEPVFFACLMALLFGTVWFAQSQRFIAAVFAGFAACAGTLTRYEGWFLIPLATAYIFVMAKRRKWGFTILFGMIASLGPLYWLAHNWWLTGNPIDFFNGPYSAKAIQRAQPYPGNQDWLAAFHYFGAAALLCAGWIPMVLAIAGFWDMLRKRTYWPALLLVLSPVFCVWAMYSSVVPIFVPNLWPHSYYNTRYGLALLPLLAFCGGASIFLASARFRGTAAIGVVFATLIPWLVKPSPENWICWKESQVNSEARRAWTHQAAHIFQSKYRTGDGIFTSSGDMLGIFREAGIPLRETLNDGNEPAWMAAVARPRFFLREGWAIAASGDPVDAAARRDYVLIRTIREKNAPVIEIYRRH
ncbi:MAG: glycosyltransferase family 39 protein [Bryobacteraceae bacterium]